MKTFPWIRWILAAVWLACWLTATRYAMLDDALIHLRYAAFLHDIHHITYDGAHISYGTSSLAYVALLAILREVTQSPILPKIVSSVCYILVLVVLFSLEARFARRTAPQLLWAALVLTSLAPMAIRWMTDGMETSLLVLATLAVVLATRKLGQASSIGVSLYLVLVLLGCFVVLLRVELLMLITLATCVAVLVRLANRASGVSNAGLLITASPMLFGGLIAAAGIRIGLGSLLPDTAIAKSQGFSPAQLNSFIHVSASAFAWGVGLVALTALSGVLILVELVNKNVPRTALLAGICVNSCLPVVLALTVLRGQAVQGFRYFVWPVYFTILWNALEWGRIRSASVKDEKEGKWAHSLLWAYFAIFACLLPLDWRYALKTMKGRSNTFEEMRSAGLERYRKEAIIAADIGFIGYFSGGSVCDLNGLVGGRALAKLTFAERTRRCAANHPQVMFLNRDQIKDVSPFISLSEWTVVRAFNFENVAGDDFHSLMILRSGGAPQESEIRERH